MERLIGGHERGGHVTFQDFIKYLSIYHEGDVRHHFTEEKVDPRATLNLFQDVNIVCTKLGRRGHMELNKTEIKLDRKKRKKKKKKKRKKEKEKRKEKELITNK
jgi:hypothetical protein